MRSAQSQRVLRIRPHPNHPMFNVQPAEVQPFSVCFRPCRASLDGLTSTLAYRIHPKAFSPSEPSHRLRAALSHILEHPRLSLQARRALPAHPRPYPGTQVLRHHLPPRSRVGRSAVCARRPQSALALPDVRRGERHSFQGRTVRADDVALQRAFRLCVSR